MRFQPLSNFIIYTSISDFTSQRPIYPTAYSTFPLLFFTSVTVYLGYRKSNSSLSFQNLHLIPYSNIKKKPQNYLSTPIFSIQKPQKCQVESGLQFLCIRSKSSFFSSLCSMAYDDICHMVYGMVYGVWYSTSTQKNSYKREEREIEKGRRDISMKYYSNQNLIF